MLANRKRVTRPGLGAAKLPYGAPKLKAHLHKKPLRDGTSRGSKVERFSVTFDRALDKEVRAAAGNNISAWLAEAAREQLRREAGTEFVRQFEEKHGKVSDEMMAEVDRGWPR